MGPIFNPLNNMKTKGSYPKRKETHINVNTKKNFNSNN